MDVNIMVETLPLLGTCNLCLNEGVVKNMLIKNNIKRSKTESYIEMLLKCFSIDMMLIDVDDAKRLICNECIFQLDHCLKFREQVETSLKILEASVRLRKADEEPYKIVKASAQKENRETRSLRKLATSLGITGNSLSEDECDVKHESNNKKDSTASTGVKQESVEDREFEESSGDNRKSSEGVANNYDDDDDPDSDFFLADIKRESVDDSDFEDSTVLRDYMVKKESGDYAPKRTRKKGLSTSKKKVSYTEKRLEYKETEKMLKAGLFPFKMGKNQVFSCAICPEKSTILEDIKSHIMEHNVSNIQVAFKKMLTANLQRFYKSSTNLRCKICEVEISDFDGLKHHIKTCVSVNTSNNYNKLPFKLEKDQLDCPICEKTFLNFVSLNTHMNEHYPNHICDSCGKAFASQARLRGHKRTHEIGDFPCRYCDAVFDRVTKRENHVSKEHKSGIRYACKRCNISLSSFYARQKHLAEVHNEELKRYKCKACTQSYITPGHLSSHVRRDHLNERNHKCPKCDLAFYTRNSLKMHMIKHDGERIHVCNICNKSYQRKKTLKEHMRIHNNDKRFICPVCGRAFTQKCTLKGHLKVHERKVDSDDTIPQPLYSI